MSWNIDNLDTLARLGVLSAWGAFLGVFLLRKRPARAATAGQRRHYSIGLVIQTGAMAIVWTVQRSSNSPFTGLHRALDNGIDVLAMLLGVGSVWMITAAVRRLGKQWSVAARVIEGHELITDGPYRIVRNPIYTGIFGMMIATGLVMSTPVAMSIALPTFIAGSVLRIRSEERLLRETFGAAFDVYVNKVPSFIPGIRI